MISALREPSAAIVAELATIGRFAEITFVTTIENQRFLERD